MYRLLSLIKHTHAQDTWREADSGRIVVDGDQVEHGPVWLPLRGLPGAVVLVGLQDLLQLRGNDTLFVHGDCKRICLKDDTVEPYYIEPLKCRHRTFYSSMDCIPNT